MLWVIRIIGFGILVAILSMMIVAVFFRNGIEQDATLVYMAIMDLLVIAGVAKAILKRV
jgi:hypothetical protein